VTLTIHVCAGASGGYTPQITGVRVRAAVLNRIALKHSARDVRSADWGSLRPLTRHPPRSPTGRTRPVPSTPRGPRGLRTPGKKIFFFSGYFLYCGHCPASFYLDPPHPCRTPAACAISTLFRSSVRAAAMGNGATRPLFIKIITSAERKRRGLTRFSLRTATGNWPIRYTWAWLSNRRRRSRPAALWPARSRTSTTARQHAHRSLSSTSSRNPGQTGP